MSELQELQEYEGFQWIQVPIYLELHGMSFGEFEWGEIAYGYSGECDIYGDCRASDKVMFSIRLCEEFGDFVHFSDDKILQVMCEGYVREIQMRKLTSTGVVRAEWFSKESQQTEV